jgi:hypothetical protein
MAWTFVNDSLCTTLCLQWEPEIIAIAMLHLASCMGQMKLVCVCARTRIAHVQNWKNKKTDEIEWWTEFVRDLPAEPTLKCKRVHAHTGVVCGAAICDVVLDLYAPPTATDGAQTTPTTPLVCMCVDESGCMLCRRPVKRPVQRRFPMVVGSQWRAARVSCPLTCRRSAST